MTHKDFERITQMIHESFKDHQFTKIERNKKLRDSSGNSREFDIYIESVSNGLTINIAVECKFWKRKIEVKEIEAFSAKCRGFAEIHKIVFVSSSEYQKAAKDNARRLGVHLFLLQHSLKDDSLLQVQLGSFHVERRISGIKIEFKKELPYNINIDSTIKYANHEFSLIDFLRLVVPGMKVPVLFTSNGDLPNIQPQICVIKCEGVLFMDSDKNYEIREISLSINFYLSLDKDGLKRMSYLDVTREVELADVYDFDMGNSLKGTIVKKSNDNHYEVLVHNEHSRKFSTESKTELSVKNNNGNIEVSMGLSEDNFL